MKSRHGEMFVPYLYSKGNVVNGVAMKSRLGAMFVPYLYSKGNVVKGVTMKSRLGAIHRTRSQDIVHQRCTP